MRNKSYSMNYLFMWHVIADSMILNKYKVNIFLCKSIKAKDK